MTTRALAFAALAAFTLTLTACAPGSSEAESSDDMVADTAAEEWGFEWGASGAEGKSTGCQACDLAESRGYAGAVHADDAAGLAWGWLRSGGGATAQTLFDHAEAAKVSAWRGHRWAVVAADSCDAGASGRAHDEYSVAFNHARQGFFVAFSACNAGQASACALKAELGGALGELTWATVYSDSCGS